MCPRPWLYVTYRGYVQLYMVIYCICTKRCHNFQTMVYVVIISKPWLYAPVRGYTTCCSPYASAAYQETQESLSIIVVIRLISCLYVVIYCICTEKVPEPSDDGFKWLYDQSRGYTPQFVVIRLLVLLMRQQVIRKPRSGYVSTTVVIRHISWLCVVIYCICTQKVP